ncbi:MAG TPA: ribose-5-phosphate isomerase [Jiangellaceae bacterium]|nr:ribose-5-phosphate isomerase [Jiangellaceae bacterium]
MRVHLGSDHAGLEVKNHLVEILRGDGHDVVDHGPFGFDPDDDYPTFCLRVAEAVAAGDVGTEHTLGVVLGGSGNGEQMAANKVRGIRTALVWNEQTATLAREHNDAQVASVGARMHSLDEVVAMVQTFLRTSFSGDERHSRRIAQLQRYEQTGELPPLSDSR